MFGRRRKRRGLFGRAAEAPRVSPKPRALRGANAAEANHGNGSGGIRGWIRERLPELLPKYKTLMRYKAMAVRLRQATKTFDPVPTDALLAPPPEGRHEAVRAILEGPRVTFASIEEELRQRLDPERVFLDPARPAARLGRKGRAKAGMRTSCGKVLGRTMDGRSGKGGRTGRRKAREEPKAGERGRRRRGDGPPP